MLMIFRAGRESDGWPRHKRKCKGSSMDAGSFTHSGKAWGCIKRSGKGRVQLSEYQQRHGNEKRLKTYIALVKTSSVKTTQVPYLNEVDFEQHKLFSKWRRQQFLH